jgi:hypothetical protein
VKPQGEADFMPTIPILVDVEDTALGPVMIALKRTPGVIGFRVNLDAFTPSAARLPAGVSVQDTVLACIAARHPEAMRSREIAAATGLTKQNVASALNSLKGKKAILRAGDRLLWQLSPKAATEMGKTLALTHDKPPRKDGKPRARASREAVWQALHLAMKDGPTPTHKITEVFTTHGISGAISGALARAREKKLVRNIAPGTWELTAKGLAQVPAPHHAGA